MPRNYRKKGIYQKWRKEDMCMAIKECTENKSTLAQVARKYDLPVSTLRRRLRMFTNQEITPDDILIGRFRRTFSAAQEKLLKDYIIDMDKRMFGLRPIELRRLAFQFAEANNVVHRFNKEHEMAGEDWYNCFMSRNPDLSIRYPEKISCNRAWGLNKINVEAFFHLLSTLMEKYKFQPSRIFNADETAISITPNYTPKVISVEEKKQVGIMSSCEKGGIVSCLICCCAEGNFIPPLMILPRKKGNSELEDKCPPDTLVVCHPSGSIQANIIYPTWFNHFIEFAKPSKQDPVLLIFNSHFNHVKNFALIDAARKNHVHILCIPPHSSHRMQPLDLAFMEPLKRYYSKECTVWLRRHPDLTIKLKNIVELFKNAYLHATVPKNVIRAFETSGIYPLNKDIFQDEDFASVLTTDIDTVPGQSQVSDIPANISSMLEIEFIDCNSPASFTDKVLNAFDDPLNYNL